MEQLFTLRPIIIFIIEIFLCFLILKTNSRIKLQAFFLVLFLALYQLGEVLIIFTQSVFANIFAFSATSLLPVIGLILLEKINYNNIRYTPFLFVVPAAYIIIALINPVIFTPLSIDYCFIKFGNLIENSKIYFSWSTIYYLPLLLVGLVAAFIGFLFNKDKERKTLNFLMGISYLFILVSPALAWIILQHSYLYITSTMCTFAIFTAIITYIMVKKSSSKYL
ncbi:MAG: hypothetical protein ACLFPL_04380 [Candidatus Nanoarchaeia archaeon]